MTAPKRYTHAKFRFGGRFVAAGQTEKAGAAAGRRETGSEGRMARAVNKDTPLRAGLAAGLVFAVALSGCTMGDSGGGSGASRAGAGLDMATPGRAIERDVEAPEVFSMEETGLWDGRPSLGGVWVAHPGAESPERVLIRNTQNGETVIGALFRRERENPGPRFQVSSEAANALGILPGAPTTIRVVALRLEQTAVAPEPVAEQDGATATVQPGTSAGQGEIEAGEGEAPRRGLLAGLFGNRETTQPPAAPTIAETALAPADADVAPQAQAQPRERRGLLGLFSRNAPASDRPAAESEVAMIPLPEEDEAATPAAAPATVAPVAPARVASTLDRPFVQIGIFSVEANATGARNQMQAAGLNAEIRRGQANEREFWRVVVGPASDQAGRGQILERVRAMGFADAYAVVR